MKHGTIIKRGSWPHSCKKPGHWRRSGWAPGTVWQCNTCGEQYQIKPAGDWAWLAPYQRVTTEMPGEKPGDMP